MFTVFVGAICLLVGFYAGHWFGFEEFRKEIQGAFTKSGREVAP